MTVCAVNSVLMGITGGQNRRWPAFESLALEAQPAPQPVASPEARPAMSPTGPQSAQAPPPAAPVEFKSLAHGEKSQAVHDFLEHPDWLDEKNLAALYDIVHDSQHDDLTNHIGRIKPELAEHAKMTASSRKIEKERVEAKKQAKTQEDAKKKREAEAKKSATETPAQSPEQPVVVLDQPDSGAQIPPQPAAPTAF